MFNTKGLSYIYKMIYIREKVFSLQNRSQISLFFSLSLSQILKAIVTAVVLRRPAKTALAFVFFH